MPLHYASSALRSLRFCGEVLSFLLLAGVAYGQAAPRDIAPILSPILDKARLPALAALVIEGDAIVAQGAVGVRAAGSPDQVTIDDKFHLGSCTKSMTATMLATLVEEGKLRWDSTIGEVFPEESKNWNEAWRTVTLEQLVCHRSGLRGDVPPAVWASCWKQEGTPTEQRMMLAGALLREAPKHKAGEVFEYSNTNFTIAGLMAERTTGKAWEDLMRERLFGPLGMTSAGFGPPGSVGHIDQPRGHRADKKLLGKDAWTPVEPGPRADNPPAIGPGGTVHMSLPDWARYVGAHLVGERGGSRLLKAETFTRLHTPPGGWEYGYGWGATRRPWAAPLGQPDAKDGRVITHSGSNTMWLCVVWAAPQRGLAVLVATNCAGDAAAKALDDAAGTLIKDEAAHAK